MRDVVVFKRGQVWMVYEDSRITEAKLKTASHVTAKSRPYLIITDDELSSKNNDNLLQCIPISSKTSYLCDDDIVFMNEENDDSKLMISQMTTVDRFSLKKYMFSFSPEFMERVDDALRKRLNLNRSTDNSNYEELMKENASLRQTIAEKDEHVTKAIERMKMISEKLVDLSETNAVKTAETHQPATSKQTYGINYVPNYKTRKNNETAKNNKVSTKSHKRNKHWTVESAREFVSCYKKEGTVKCIEKYNLTSKESVYNTYYNIKKKFPNENF